MMQRSSDLEVRTEPVHLTHVLPSDGKLSRPRQARVGCYTASAIGPHARQIHASHSYHTLSPPPCGMDVLTTSHEYQHTV